jgi:hypothetical protein
LILGLAVIGGVFVLGPISGLKRLQGLLTMPKRIRWFIVNPNPVRNLQPEIEALMLALGATDITATATLCPRHVGWIGGIQIVVPTVWVMERDKPALSRIGVIHLEYKHCDKNISRRTLKLGKNSRFNIDKALGEIEALQVIKRLDEESHQRQQSQQEADRLAYEKFLTECQSVSLSDAWRLNASDGTVGISLDGLSIDQAASVQKLIDSGFEIL